MTTFVFPSVWRVPQVAGTVPRDPNPNLEKMWSGALDVLSQQLGLDLWGYQENQTNLRLGIPKTSCCFFEVFNGTTMVFLRDLNTQNRSTFVLMVLED